MKKKTTYRIMSLLIFIFISGVLHAQRNIYVSPSGGGSGDGTSDNPISLASAQSIYNSTHTTGDILNFYFFPGEYEITTHFQMTTSGTNNRTLNITFDKISGTIGEVVFKGSNNNNRFLTGPNGGSSYQSYVTIKNVTFKDFENSSGSNPLIGHATTYTHIELENVIIDNYKGSSYMINFASNNSSFKIKNSTIKNSTASRILHMSSTGGTTEVSGSSIYNNQLTDAVLYLNTATTGLIYNNTLSNNSLSSSTNYATYISTSGIRFFNNTVYNSGRVQASTNSNGAYIVNNVIVGTSYLYEGTGSANSMRNISSSNGSIYYYSNGYTNGNVITDDFNQQFDINLTDYEEPGKQVHKIMGTHEDVIHGQGGEINNLYSTLVLSSSEINMQKDQLGNPRPSVVSIGSLDTEQLFQLNTTPRIISSIYDSNGTPSSPESVSIDLSRFISVCPSGVNIDNITFTVDDSELDNGTVTYDLTPGSRYITFNPYAVNYQSSGFKVYLSVTDQYGVFHKSTIYMNTLVYNKSTTLTPSIIPPGYVIPEDYWFTCYDFMGTVEFQSTYKFVTGILPNTNHVESLNLPVPSTNDNRHRLYGFSIPLVGDLNGDGYPEIVGLGVDDGHASTTPTITYIYIYSGQTGEELTKFTLPMSWTARTGGWHNTPSNLAIVDADRNGLGEIIIAYGNGSGNYNYSLASYEITSKTDFTLKEKWSNTDYKYHRAHQGVTTVNTNFSKPLPQIVDIDGDGTPELLVYNKIYNAKTGDFIMELETLPTSGEGWSSSYAYVGRDEGMSVSGDNKIPFSYVYDIDMDGKYDVIAGGKVYYDIDLQNKTYKMVHHTGIPDGRTGVADINGDGIPDIVVLNRIGSTANSSVIFLRVWNPGFHIVDEATGKIIKNPTAPTGDITTTTEYMANVSIPQSRTGTGSGSYVFIGDIDGRVQEKGGKKYRLPEIAVLGAGLDRATTYNNGLIHPNVKDIAIADGGIPTTGSTSGDGSIIAVTWDVNETDVTKRLKLSFVLEHEDSSVSTGFTMFDFDNDGMQEICYRDERTLRILKVAIPYIGYGYTDVTHPDVIKFRKTVHSYTGMEYPVIADIDNDASADMIVMGYNPTASGGTHTNRDISFVYSVGAAGDKFAPSLKVWNQFMYDPFKINEDLTTPEGPAPNRLEYTFYKKNGEEVIEFQPYNATLLQATRYMLVDDDSYGKVYDPIVFLTEAYIVDNNDPEVDKRPTLTGTDGNITIEITIGNHETALTDVSTLTPIAIYKNGTISKENYVGTWTLNQLYYAGTTEFANEAIRSGTEVRVSIHITGSDAQADEIYMVRLGDDSGLNGSSWEWKFGLNSLNDGTPDPDRGIGVASRAYRDCDWSDQTVRAAKLNIFPDAATVQAYQTVSIPIFDNDILPDSFFSPFEWNSSEIIQEPVAGNLSISGTGRDTKVIYQNIRTDILTESVDSFVYRASFIDPTINPTVPQTKTTTAYIYVLQSKTGYATCAPQYTIELKELPQGNISFNWYKDDIFSHTGSSKVINNMQADSTYMVEPRVSATYSANYYRNVSFPTGELTILYTDNAVTSTMKWTGITDNDWYNPWNWVEIKTVNNKKTEIPVSYAPNGCVDVIIPSDAPHYPELTYKTECNNITMEDRAIIGKIHLLDYSEAKVELTLRPTEKERFVMWSAPLRDMYTGDYHYTDNSNNPVWGDIYMNFFQSTNPDGGTAYENAFTATFGDVNTKLPLGTPFNIRVENRDMTKTFQFPKTQTSYTDANGNPSPQPLSRSNSSRFIFEEMTEGSDGVTVMKVNGQNNYRMIQVSNPFMAYLDAGAFLSANSTVIEGAYKIWNGDTTSNFVSIKYVDEATGQRYFIEDVNAVASETSGYIPPLQSFFVMKHTSSQQVSELKMSGDWTTAIIPNGPDYTLRSNVSDLEQHILRVTASDGTNSNTTILYYDEMAIPDYRGNEDSYKLFNPYSPLEIYTIASTYERLAFYASGDYSRNVRLGIRKISAGQVTLDFVGMERFRHDVYLIDHEDNEKVYDLSVTPSLVFDIQPYSTGQYIDLPNRFSLSFVHTGYDASNQQISNDKLQVVANNGHVKISAGGKIIENLQIYNIWGQRVYQTRKANSYFEIPLHTNQFYIVKGQIDYQISIVKTLLGN